MPCTRVGTGSCPMRADSTPQNRCVLCGCLDVGLARTLRVHATQLQVSSRTDCCDGRSKPEVLKIADSCVAVLGLASRGMHTIWHRFCVLRHKFFLMRFSRGRARVAWWISWVPVCAGVPQQIASTMSAHQMADPSHPRTIPPS